MFYAFDVLVRRGEDFTKQTLSKRRDIFASTIKPRDQNASRWGQGVTAALCREDQLERVQRKRQSQRPHS